MSDDNGRKKSKIGLLILSMVDDDGYDKQHDVEDHVAGDGKEQERGALLEPRRGVFPEGGSRGAQESGHCRVSSG